MREHGVLQEARLKKSFRRVYSSHFWIPKRNSMIATSFLIFCRVVLGLVFVLALVGKWRDLQGFRQSIMSFRLIPDRLSGVVAFLCLVGECAVLLGMIVGNSLLL